MDRERLAKLLRAPSEVTESDMASLRSMAERFPWFSGARLLLAVGEQRTGGLLANDSHIPAAFLSSREVLFELARKERPGHAAPLRVVKDEPAEQEPASHVTVEPPTILETVPPVSPAPAQAEVDQASGPAPEEAPEVVIAPAVMAEAPVDVVQKGPGGEEAQDPPATATSTPVEQAEDGLLGRMYKESILASTYDLDQWAVPAEEATPTPDMAGEAQAGPSPIPAPLPEPEPESPRPVTRQGRLHFTAWLEIGLTDTPVQDQAPVPAPASPLPVAAKAQLGQQEIMDRFIRQDTPQPPKEKAAFFNPQQAAKQSLKDDGLVSETLARIHEKQGNLAKAKEVYDRLAALHPEKSIYFAALSKALEARMTK